MRFDGTNKLFDMVHNCDFEEDLISETWCGRRVDHMASSITSSSRKPVSWHGNASRAHIGCHNQSHDQPMALQWLMVSTIVHFDEKVQGELRKRR